MKRHSLILISILAVFFFACAGGNSVKKKPNQIISGIKEVNKGTIWYQKGCYKRSLEHFFRAHELFAASDHLSGVAMSMNNIGNIYRITGEINGAVLFFEESFGIYRDIENHEGAVQALSNKAAALIDGGRLDEASKILSTAEDIAQKYKILSGPLLRNQGIIFARKKEFNRAEVVLKRAIEITDSSNFSEIAAINFALGNLNLETERYEKAIDFFEAALAADRSAGFHNGIADDLAAIGSAFFRQEKNKDAVDFFKRSIKIYALMGNEKKVHTLMEQLEKAAEKAVLDISLTKHFVTMWLEGNLMKDPCR